jgi:hypothetical protein
MSRDICLSMMASSSEHCMKVVIEELEWSDPEFRQQVFAYINWLRQRAFRAPIYLAE